MDVVSLGVLVLVVLSGWVAGGFLLFSDFLMRAFAQAQAGADSMITLNRVIYRSIFLTSFMVLTPLAAALAWLAPHPAQIWLAMGAGVYAILVFGVTAAFNVPLNTRLDRAGAADDAVWRHYVRVWTRWNHVRTLGASLAFILFVMGFAHLV